MDNGVVVAIVIGSAALISNLYALVGKRDPVMMKLIEEKIDRAEDKRARMETDLLNKIDTRASKEDLQRLEDKVDQLLNKAGG